MKLINHFIACLLMVAAVFWTGGSAVGQSIDLEIEGRVFGQGVSNGLNLNDLIAIYPEDTPVALSFTIDRIGPTQGQVTAFTGTLDGEAISLFDYSTVPDLPPGFVPNVVDLINDGSSPGNFTGDIFDVAVDIEGPTVLGVTLQFFTIDLIDSTGTMFGPGQVDLFTDDIDVDVFDDSPALGFLQFATPDGNFNSPRAFVSFVIDEVSGVSGTLDGDYNGDGFVSQGDLDLVLLNWGDSAVPAEWLATDQFDGVQVSQNELDGVLLNWGNGTPPSAAVPEPTTATILVAFASIYTRRRR